MLFKDFVTLMKLTDSKKKEMYDRLRVDLAWRLQMRLHNATVYLYEACHFCDMSLKERKGKPLLYATCNMDKVANDIPGYVEILRKINTRRFLDDLELSKEWFGEHKGMYDFWW